MMADLKINIALKVYKKEKAVFFKKRKKNLLINVKTDKRALKIRLKTSNNIKD
jgi:hypothetical protein